MPTTTRRRAIVFGGSAGLGAEIARALVTRGIDTVIVARDDERRVRRCATLRDEAAPGTVVEHVRADVRDRAQVDTAVAEAVRLLGGIDILVNSAYSTREYGDHGVPIADYDEGPLSETLDIKLLGYLRSISAVAPHLIAQGWGRIINLGGQGLALTESILGSVRNAAVAALTANVADELGPHGITVNVIHPGTTLKADAGPRHRADDPEHIDDDAIIRSRLESQSTPRLTDASDIGNLVAFLVSDEAWFINGEGIGTGPLRGRVRTYI